MAEFIELLSVKALADLQLANKELTTMVANVDKVGNAMKGVTIPSGSDSAVKDLTEQYKKQEAIITELQKKLLLLNTARASGNQRTSEEIVNQRALAQSADRQTRATSALVGAYARLNAQHQQAKKTLQDLIASQTASVAQIRTAQQAYDVLDRRIIRADTAVRSFNRNVGNYPRQAVAGIRSLMGAFGLFGGVYLFASVIKDAFNTVKEFDKATADLAATLGKNRKEIIALTNSAQAFGATTIYTATQVTELQKELGKLGFSETEILKSTKGILSLASAVDTDLAKAAEVGGSTLRAFQLDASEMGRVVDVMAKGFTSSALDIDNFKESIKYVAPIAAASNISLEQTTALLGVLADNGIKGSQAGTSLRRIMTDIVKTGKPFNEGFKEIAKNGISVKDAFDEVGRTAQTSLVVLGKNIEKIQGLTTALDDAAGSAQKMADEQLQSLNGQITLLTSAWDGLIISLNNSETGGFSGFVTMIVKGLTAIINMITVANKGLKDLQNESGAERKTNVKQNVFDASKDLAQIEFRRDSKWYDLYIKRNRESFKQQFKNNEDYLKAKKRIETEFFASAITDKKAYDARIREIEVQEATRQLDFEKQKLAKAQQNARDMKRVYEDSSNGLIDYIPGAPNRTKELKQYNDALLQVSDTEAKIAGLKEILAGETQVLTEVINKESEATVKGAKAKKEAEIYQVGSLKWLNQQISQLKELNDTMSLSNEEYLNGVGAIKFYEEWVKRLTGSIKKLEEETEGISLDFGGSEFITDAEGDKSKEEGDRFREMLSEFKQSFIDDFANQSGFSGLLEILSGSLDKFEGDAVSTALAISEAFQQAFNTIAEFSSANFDQMYSNLEKQKDVAIMFAGDGTAAKEEIERQYEEKRKRIQKQQAESEKRMAMFNIAVNTGQAIVATLAKTPLPLGLPLVIATAAIGAAQLAMVASQRIPAFKDGGVHDGGLMLVNDGTGSNYNEKVVTPDGKIHTPQGRNVVMNAPQGTQIFTHDQWQDGLNNILMNNGIKPTEKGGTTVINNGMSEDAMRNVMREFGFNVNIDENGFRKMLTSQGQKRTSLNSRLRIERYDI